MSKQTERELRSVSLFDPNRWGIWEWGRDRRFGAWALEPAYSKRKAEAELAALNASKKGEGAKGER